MMDFLEQLVVSCGSLGRSKGVGDKAVASELGMQVIHWEREGVMDIFRETSEAAAVNKLKDLIKRKPSLISQTDPSRDNVGAALLHWAVIHRGVFQTKSSAAVVDYLIREASVIDVMYKQPRKSLGIFDGESALHLAVAFNDKKLIKQLLRSNANPTMRAVGTFFQPSGPCYFGEYPLSFAVACGNVELAEILCAGGRGKHLLPLKDSFGNTALHIGAIHRRQEFFDWLLVRLENTEGIQIDRQTALRQQGACGLTPLGLATVYASVDNGGMFDFILSRMSRVEWTFGRVSCTSVPLDQLDTIPLDPLHPRHVSILSLVLCRRIYSLSTHPHLVGVMEAKWEQFAAFAFFVAFVLHVGRLVVVTSLAIYYRHYLYELEVSKRDNVPRPSGGNVAALISLEWWNFVDSTIQCVLVFIDCYAGYLEDVTQKEVIRKSTEANRHKKLPPVLRSIPDGDQVFRDLIARNSFSNHAKKSDKVTSWLSAHVPLSEYDFFAWIGQVLSIFHVVLFYVDGKDPQALTTGVLSIALLSYWMSSLKFTAFSKELGMLTTIIFRTVKTDVTSFLAIFSIFLVGFATALHIMGTSESYSATLDRLVKTALADTGSFPDWGSTPEHNLSWLSYFLHLWFAICSLVILLNLLISIFSCTFSSVQDESEREWRLAKGRVTLLLERRIKLLLPCMMHRMRVNHFSEFVSESESDKHRYVFVTEAEDDRMNEEETMRVAVKGALEDLLRDGEENQEQQEGNELEELTFQNLAMSEQPEEVLPEDAPSADGVELRDIVVHEPILDPVSISSPREASDLAAHTRALLKSHDNPLTTVLSDKFEASGSACEEIGLLRWSPRPLDQTRPPVGNVFDDVAGPQAWERFVTVVSSELGSIAGLVELSSDEIKQVVHAFLQATTSPFDKERCFRSLSSWVDIQREQSLPT
ncbi:hypothetical protein DIPPA_34773 [Diplonema papillatum]|nr:hypothetical protein DIPPA_34773 [Diplonema papillatum]